MSIKKYLKTLPKRILLLIQLYLIMPFYILYLVFGESSINMEDNSWFPWE